MRIPEATKRQIIETIGSHLPDRKIVAVQARPNKRRIFSYRRHGSGIKLNLSDAVVEAGEDAWILVGRMMAGERGLKRRLVNLIESGLRKNAATKNRRRQGTRPGSHGSHGLPNTRCEGTPKQGQILRDIIAWAKETSGYAKHFPEDLQIRVSRRMSRSLGTHTHLNGHHRITITHRLFYAGIEDVLLDTVLHELAHLLDARTRPSGKTDHGPQWKMWCRRIGAMPRRLIPRSDSRRIQAAESSGRPGEHPDLVRDWVSSRTQGCPKTQVRSVSALNTAQVAAQQEQPDLDPSGQYRLI